MAIVVPKWICMKILLVDDDTIVRESLVRLLKTFFDDRVTFVQAQNGDEAIQKLTGLKLDLVFLDISMPIMDGYETCKYLRKNCPELPVIMLTHFSSDELVDYFYKLGARAFLPKGASVDELRRVVEAVTAGKKYFRLQDGRSFNRKLVTNNDTDLSLKITRQEKRLLQFLQEGLTSKEIAAKMSLTDKTIRTYKERLMGKTKARNVAELISFGFRNGILH